MRHHRLDVESRIVVNGTRDVCDRNHLGTKLGRGQGRILANIAKSVNYYTRAIDLDPHMVCGGGYQADQTTPGRFSPRYRPSKGRRFSGNDSRFSVTHVCRVGVHDPAHGVFVGTHVWGWDVLVRADELDDLHGVTTR